MESDSGTRGDTLYLPLIQGFTDTGFVQHKFNSGSEVTVGVVPALDYSDPASLAVVVKDSEGNTCCDIIMDKFSALCLAEAIIKNLMNQEELVYNARKFNIARANSGASKGLGSET